MHKLLKSNNFFQHSTSKESTHATPYILLVQELLQYKKVCIP